VEKRLTNKNRIAYISDRNRSPGSQNWGFSASLLQKTNMLRRFYCFPDCSPVSKVVALAKHFFKNFFCVRVNTRLVERLPGRRRR
jgi:hypothetical protein